MRKTFVKIISLDANTHFNRIADIYSGGPDTLSIAAGIVIHAGAELFPGESYYALYEPASDSHSGNDGPLGGSVVMPGGKPGNVYYFTTENDADSRSCTTWVPARVSRIFRPSSGC